MEKSPAKGSDLKTLAIFPASEFFYNKILSRNSSVGSSSSRSYFGRVTGSVPFQWEAKPGKPKLEAHDEEQQQQKNFDFVQNPPLIIGPPPATQSLDMNSLPYSSGPFSNSRVWLWKKLKKTHKLKRTHKLKKVNKNNGEANFDVAGLEQLYHQADLCKSDEEIMKFGSYGSSSSSSCNSSSLSSTASASVSSSSSSTSDQNFRPSKIQRLARGFIRWAF